MVDKKIVKEIMFSLGADLCGIASIDRFADAPKGYHPLDVLPTCKSVISFGCRLPVGTLTSQSHVIYTRVRNSLVPKVDGIALDFCIEMEKHHIVCVPVPANESQWDKNTGRWRSVVSQKHAAQAAGLGTIGRHSLLITPEFGSMIWLGAVLCEYEFEPDSLKEPVCTNCDLCVNICPVNALETPELKQQICYEYAFGNSEEEQIWRIACHKCRDVCPYNLGSKNSILKKG
ncbi:MAG: 4Fe-4S double cluster binding domain-containing protein [Massiliimalia sp.]|jgi:epoxyqueuosine reductase